MVTLRHSRIGAIRLLAGLAAVGVAVTLGLALSSESAGTLSAPGGPATALGRLAGLVGTYLRRSPDDVLTDADLYLRGTETLLASWEEYARGATGAAVQRFPGVATAVSPNEPERAVYNNAPLERDLAAAERAHALDAMEAAYAAAGVTRFAAWVHESDQAMRTDLERRGYTLDGSTPRWAWPWPTSACPDRRSNSGHRTGLSTCASSGCRWVSSVGPITPSFTF
jgi:hypothetical protein